MKYRTHLIFMDFKQAYVTNRRDKLSIQRTLLRLNGTLTQTSKSKQSQKWVNLSVLDVFTRLEDVDKNKKRYSRSYWEATGLMIWNEQPTKYLPL